MKEAPQGGGGVEHMADLDKRILLQGAVMNVFPTSTHTAWIRNFCLDPELLFRIQKK